MHQKQNILRRKINSKKTKARFGRLLPPPAWKRNRSILEEVYNNNNNEYIYIVQNKQS